MNRHFAKVCGTVVACTEDDLLTYAAQVVADERNRCAILAASAAAHAQCGDWLDACKALDRLKAGLEA